MATAEGALKLDGKVKAQRIELAVFGAGQGIREGSALVLSQLRMAWRSGNVEALRCCLVAIDFKLPGVPLAGNKRELSEIDPELGINLRALRDASWAPNLKIALKFDGLRPGRSFRRNNLAVCIHHAH
jgi:hypothetical protein